MANTNENDDLDNGQGADLSILGDASSAGRAAPAQVQPEDDTPDFDIIVDDGEDGEAPAPQQQAAQTQEAEDDEGDSSHGDQEPQRQPGFREPRWSKNRRRAEARDRDKRMLAEQNRRIQELERILQAQQESQNQFVARFEPKLNEITEASIRNQRADLERRAADAARNFETLDNQFYAAWEAGDYARARELGRQRDEASANRIRFGYALETFDNEVKSRQAAQPRQQQETRQAQTQQSPQLDPVATRMAQDFIRSDAPWYGKRGSEDDSAIMDAIERRVYEDGFDRTTPEFWDELADRASRALPHRFQEEPAPQQRQQTQGKPAVRQQAQQTPPLRRGPPTGAPGNTRSANGPLQFRLTPAHLEAARAANLIDENNRPIDKKEFYKVAQEWAANDRAMRAGQ